MAVTVTELTFGPLAVDADTTLGLRVLRAGPRFELRPRLQIEVYLNGSVWVGAAVVLRSFDVRMDVGHDMWTIIQVVFIFHSSFEQSQRKFRGIICPRT
jgi:hypothetical protein